LKAASIAWAWISTQHRGSAALRRGITERTALKIVEFRNEHGRFRSRVQLNAVPGIGPKTFEQQPAFFGFATGQSARHERGSSRVLPRGGADRQSLNVPVRQLLEQPALLDKVDKSGWRRCLHAE